MLLRQVRITLRRLDVHVPQDRLQISHIVMFLTHSEQLQVAKGSEMTEVSVAGK